jgi:hypothetical protein
MDRIPSHSANFLTTPIESTERPLLLHGIMQAKLRNAISSIDPQKPANSRRPTQQERRMIWRRERELKASLSQESSSSSSLGIERAQFRFRGSKSNSGSSVIFSLFHGGAMQNRQDNVVDNRWVGTFFLLACKLVDSISISNPDLARLANPLYSRRYSILWTTV